MKYLTITVAFLAITGALISLRGLGWHPAGAQYVKTDDEPDGAVARVTDKSGDEAAALDVVFADAGERKDVSGDKLFARLAADCASHLYEKAKKQPGNVRLLEQAAAHYRACLSHEGTVEDPANLFADARKNLQQIEGLLASAKSREAAPKVALARTPASLTASQVAEQVNAVLAKLPASQPPSAASKKQDEEEQGFGPDGVTFSKERPGD
jgi:hypothetical protein